MSSRFGERSAAAPRMSSAALARRLVAGAMLISASAVHAQGVLPEVQVSKSDIPDYEFDWGRNGVMCPTCNFNTGNARFAFSDVDGKLWLGYVDFQTGAFLPPDGHAVLIDTNTAAATDFGNGPEWMSSTAGSQLVYTKYRPGEPHSDQSAGIAMATMVNGAWSAGFLSDALACASPAGTLDLSDTAPRINYVTTDKSKLYWRSMAQPDVEHDLPINQLTDGNSRRWVPGTRSIIFQGTPTDSTDRLKDQVFLYDTDSGVLQQLTFDPNGKLGAMMWRAPEYNNEYVFFTMASFRRQLLVYRKLPDANGVMRWTVIKSIDTPSALPYIWSPEAFVHNGRSYIFMQLSASSKFWDRTVPNQLAITGIDPLHVDFRMLTNDSQTPRLRLDPEYFITAQGPFIYYNRLIPETATRPALNDGVWRVDTKLGPRKSD